MSLRATGRAAEDLLTLIRALRDPNGLDEHLEKIAAGSTKLAQDIDAVKAREAAVDERENAANALHNRQMQAADALDDRGHTLVERERQLNAQAQDIELKVRNHGAEVAEFEKRAEMHRDEIDRQRTQMAALRAQIDKERNDHAARKQALDDREVALNGMEAALNERAKRIAEALK